MMLNKQATETFRKLLELLGKKNHMKLDNSNGVFMPLGVERVDKDIISLAHYWVCNGDLMADPEMTFKVSDEGIKPLTYRNDGLGYYVECKSATFANTFLSNIKEQQHI